MIKAILFDMGGVICEEGFKKGIAAYEKKFNIPTGVFYKIVHDHQAWKDFTLGRITESQFLSACQTRAGNYVFDSEYFVKSIEELTIPNVTVVDLIDELSCRYIIGIVSNHPREWFDRFVGRIHLSDKIKVLAVSGYLNLRKPSREIFLEALRQAKIKPEEAIYIDDRPDMVEEARELGINVIVFDGNVDKLKQEIVKL